MSQATIKELQAKIDALTAELSDAEDRIEELEDEKDSGELRDAIDRLLDEVERPTGSLAAVLPSSPAASRALIALHDVIGRRF